MQEWTADGRYGWIFGANAEDSFSIDGDVAGFDLTGVHRFARCSGLHQLEAVGGYQRDPRRSPRRMTGATREVMRRLACNEPGDPRAG